MIGLRTHGGPGIGLGHVRRCLTLAEALRRLGAPVAFIVSAEASTRSLIERHAFEGVIVGESASEPDRTLGVLQALQIEILITDSYEFGPVQLTAWRPWVKTLVALDDMADRALPVDVVINAAIGAEQLAYARLTQARLLLGPQYCLLREEFAREPDRLIRPEVSHILITVGGSDPQHLTARLMDWVRQVQPAVQLDVIIGPFFDQRLNAADDWGTLHHDPRNIRDLMVGCDLAICGGGQTALELAATGTPALAIQLADNQAHNLTGLSRAGTLHLVGRGDDHDLAERVTSGLVALIADPSRRAVMSAQGRALIDGRGAARVAQAILAEFHRGDYAEDQNR